MSDKKNPIEQLGWSKVYNVVLLDPELDNGALRTLLLYQKHTSNGKSWPSRETMARLLGVDVSTITRHNATLEKLGYIKREPRDGLTTITKIEDITSDPRLIEIAEEYLEGRKNAPSVGAPVRSGPLHKCAPELDSLTRSIEQDNQFSFAVGEGDPACFAQDCTHNSPLVSINGKHTGDDSGLFLCKGQSESLTEAEDKAQAHVPNHQQLSFRAAGENWDTSISDLARRALSACGRKKFGSREHSRRWHKIESSAKRSTEGASSDDPASTEYPLAWVEAMIKWAEEKNAERARRTSKRGVIITFPKLLTAIENDERRRAWISKQQQFKDKRASKANRRARAHRSFPNDNRTAYAESPYA